MADICTIYFSVLLNTVANLKVYRTSAKLSEIF